MRIILIFTSKNIQLKNEYQRYNLCNINNIITSNMAFYTTIFEHHNIHQNIIFVR